MALGKHLVQAVPFVYALQCPAGKVDNNNNKIHFWNMYQCNIFQEDKELVAHYFHCYLASHSSSDLSQWTNISMDC